MLLGPTGALLGGGMMGKGGGSPFRGRHEGGSLPPRSSRACFASAAGAPPPQRGPPPKVSFGHPAPISASSQTPVSGYTRFDQCLYASSPGLRKGDSLTFKAGVIPSLINCSNSGGNGANPRPACFSRLRCAPGDTFRIRRPLFLHTRRWQLSYRSLCSGR
jgi:hypothetical protein